MSTYELIMEDLKHGETLLEFDDLFEILKNNETYRLHPHQLKEDYPSILFHFGIADYICDCMKTHQDLSVLLDMSIESRIELINEVHMFHEFDSSFSSWKNEWLPALYKIFSDQPDIRSNRKFAKILLEQLQDLHLMYVYYWSLSEELKLDVDLASLAVKRNPKILDLCRVAIRNRKEIQNLAEEAQEAYEEYEWNLSDQEEAVEYFRVSHYSMNESDETLEREKQDYEQYLKDHEYPDSYKVDFRRLRSLKNPDVLVVLMEYGLTKEECFWTKDLYCDHLQSVEFLERLVQSKQAKKIVERYQKKMYFDMIHLDWDKHVDLIYALLKKDIFIPNCPYKFLKTKEDIVHFYRSTTYIFSGYCDKELGENMIHECIEKNEDCAELIALYLNHYRYKSPGLNEDVLRSRQCAYGIANYSNDVQKDLKLVSTWNEAILSEEDFVKTYCDRILKQKLKLTSLPTLKNKAFVNIYYKPLLFAFKQRDALGATLQKRYAKVLKEAEAEALAQGQSLTAVDDVYKPLYEFETKHNCCLIRSKNPPGCANKIILFQHLDKVFLERCFRVRRADQSEQEDTKVLQIFDTCEPYENHKKIKKQCEASLSMCEMKYKKHRIEYIKNEFYASREQNPAKKQLFEDEMNKHVQAGVQLIKEITELKEEFEENDQRLQAFIDERTSELLK